MWIDRLDLLAFGHFTDVRLTLGPGLHLIYGPNEAGKSTTLRAIRQFLFGFDERTTDNFVHQNPNLRIGGVLRDESGRTLEVIRRKTRKDSLLAADQQTAIDPNVWDEWLCHIDESTFSNRYGIDYEQLIKGAHEIATGTGDLGEILFAAGSGILDLTAVQKSLADEAAEIFRPQGKKQRLNQAIVEWQTQRDIVTKSLLPVAEWEEADKRRQDSLARLQSVSAQVQQIEGKLDLLRRKQKARPFWVELKQLEEEVARYESTPSLPTGFVAKKQDAIWQWKQSTTTEVDERELLQKLDDEIGRIVVPAGIIECATEIAELLTEWGSIRKAQTDRPGLVEQKQRLLEQSQSLLSRFDKTLDQRRLTDLTIDRDTRQKMAQFAQRQSRLSTAISQAEKQCADLDSQFGDASKRAVDLPEISDVDRLRTAVKEVRATGDLESQWQQVSQEIERTKARILEQCQQLGIAIESSQKLKTIRVPSDDAIRFQDAKQEEIRSEKAVLQARIRELDAEFKDLKLKIDELRDKFQVPYEEDLDQARAERNVLTKRIRESIEGNKVPSLENWKAFEAVVERADLISDRLRREADRVANLVELSADLNSNETKQHDISIRLAALNTSQIELEKRWQSDWPDLENAPQAIRDLQNWLAKRQIVIQLHDDLNRRESLAADLYLKIETNKKSLTAVLDNRSSSSLSDAKQDQETPPASPRKQLSFGWDSSEERTDAIQVPTETSSSLLLSLPLRELLEQAERKLEQHEQDQVAHREATHLVASVERQRSVAQSQLKAFQAEFGEWNAAWQQQLRDLELPVDSTPELVTSLIETAIEHSALARQIEQLHDRISGIDDDATMFRTRVKTLFERIAPDLIGAENENAIKSIQQRLNLAQRDQSKLDELKQRKKISQQKLAAAQDARKRAVDLIYLLLREKGGSDSLTLEPTSDQFEDWVAELDQFEVSARQKSLLEEKASRLKDRLKEFAKDESFISFSESLVATESSEWESQIQSLKRDCERLESERDQLNQQIGSAEQQLSEMDGASNAAEAEEQQSLIFARIRSDVEQFARAKLASGILHAAIERYRDRIRGPVLKLASELFRELTLGSFDGLRVDEDDSGKPVLVGLRCDQRTRVSVDGMSEGTCDQLYLALRMASLQLEAAPRSHLPFIIDDILIQFDDARSAAALKVLARFSQQRQMIFFTHHDRLIEIARRELGSGVTTHQLSS